MPHTNATTSSRRKLPVPFFEVLDQEYAALHGGTTTAFSWNFSPDHLLGATAGLLEKILPLLPAGEAPAAAPSPAELARLLNLILQRPTCLYADKHFPKAGLRSETVAMTRLELEASELTRLNRLLLEEAFPEHLKKISDLHLAAIYRRIHAGEGSTALCISGGGIRSATFALGVTQGLAQHGLLKHFDYLSTVSGGGYLGSWLSSWIHHAGGVDAVSAKLSGGRPESVTEPEPRQLSHLRKYSNYLTPRLGLFSADTWVLVAMYSRNLALNWLVFAPILFALFAVPRLHTALLILNPPDWLIGLGFFFGFVLAAWAIAYSAMNRPTLREQLQAHGGRWLERRDQAGFLVWCCAPLCLAALCITTAWAWVQNGSGSESSNLLLRLFLDLIGGTPDAPPFLPNYCLLGAILHLTAWSTAELFLQRWRHGKKHALKREVALALATGAAGGFSLWLAAMSTLRYSTSPTGLSIYGCLAAPVFLMLFLITATLFIGLGSRFTFDEDREWWARMGAWLLVAIVGWMLFNGLVLFGPVGIFKLSERARTLLGALGGISGLFTLIIGHSAGSSGTKPDKRTASPVARLLDKAVSLAAPLSLAALVAAISLATSWIFSRTLTVAANHFCTPLPDDKTAHPGLYNLAQLHPFSDFSELASTAPLWLTTGFVLACGLAGWLLSRFININKFSLHAIYRNRLVRAYLGATNPRRNPNPFTGFDPGDNLPMQILRDPKNPLLPQRPLHLVNMALNLVSGENLAWQQRKAETFTASTLYTGNYRLGYRFTKHYAINRMHNGLSLGTALSISGAAASPNQGYHSSPVVALLMTLFNVRLGWWLGNPGALGCDTFHDDSPRSPVRHMIKEGLGLTDSTSPYVYLSDGGHFENLGLYEMILRRARLIVLSDAGCDPDCSLEDLGNAIRKVRVDLGVKISVTKFEIFSRDDEAGQKCGRYCAVCEIDYGSVDAGGRKGTLIYIKPALLGSEPRDIYNYARTSETFPHEPTSDQWFDEAQFESYRALGQRTVEWIYSGKCHSIPPATERNDLFTDFVKQAYAASETPSAPHLGELFEKKP